MTRRFPVFLNGAEAAPEEAARFIDALSDARVLTANGGYLFKSRFADGTLHIGIVPAISEGQRLHHYDISVPEGRHLIGSVTAVGGFALLFKTGSGTLDSGERLAWREQFAYFAAGLIGLGYAGEGKLDKITGMIIEESGIAPDPAAKPPERLEDLAGWTA